MNSPDGQTLLAAGADSAEARGRLLALRLRQRRPGTAEEPLRRRLGSEAIPLSFSQEGLWFLDQLSGPGSAYNVTRALRLHGRVEPSLFERSLRALVRRHESLRTAFATRDGTAVQIVRPALEAAACLRFETLSLDGWSDAEVGNALSAALSAAAEPFDLACAPLLRAKLVRIRDDQHVLIVVVHHIVCDGWSVGILLRELSALYAAGAEAAALPPLPAQFADYSAWQRRRLTPEVLNAQLCYWREQLKDVATLELAADRPRPAQPSRRGATEGFLLPKVVIEPLHALARRHNATLFMVLFAAFQVLLMRHARQDDIAVGVPVANRNRVELEGLVGYFVNTLVMRSNLAGNPTFAELLERVRKTVLDAFAHQEVPFERLVAELRPERDPNRNPLYQVSFSLQSQPPAALTIEGVRAEEIALPGTEAKFDLLMTLTEADGALHGSLVYAAELFDASTMRSLASRYRALLAGIAAAPATGIRHLPLLDEVDHERVLHTWNATTRPYDARTSAHALIERQVGLTPDAVALTQGGVVLSYRELDAKANRLARHLRARGVGRGMLVGLATERGIDMVVAQLAILKAGAGYLPLDTSYPAQRLAFMIEDARLALLITESCQLEKLAPPRERCVLVDIDRPATDAYSEERLPPDAALDSRPEDPAYVIYTSGSTGRPKGVVLSQRSLVNLLTSVAREPGFSASDRVLAITTVSFDIAVMELLVPLSVGAGIILASRDQARDGQALREMLEQSGANFMQATPLTWRMLVDAGWRGSPKFRAITGGESLSQALATSLLERVSELWNGYGPSETTVYSTFWRVEHPGRGISIGRPVANTVVRVLDEYGQLCPPGVSGEIYIGGDGLALGYLGQPELTAERFIPDAFGDTLGARLYRTGDQGRWRHDGLLEHQGRLDFQVKIRGFRIELGEVEAHLSAHPHVAQSAVVVREDAAGDPCLVAYVVSGTTVPGARDLRDHLRARLPDFMVPQHFVALDALPRLPNGKTDRKALPALRVIAPQLPRASLPSGLEQTIARIWCEVLNVQEVGREDNFFDIGGHSIAAAKVVARLRDATGSDIPLRALFESPTVAALAATLEQGVPAPKQVGRPVVIVGQIGIFPASLAQASLWFLNEVSQGRAVYNIPRAVSLSGQLDFAVLARSVQALIERHASLRTGFELRDGVPVQVIRDLGEIAGITTIEPVQVQGVTAAEREYFVETTLQAMAGEPFDLSRPPLMRVRVLRSQDREHVLLLVVHHIVSDGWSINILMHELSALYRAFRAGESNPLRALPMQFADHVIQTGGDVDARRIDEDLEYWRRQLAHLTPLDLPTDRAYPEERSYRGATHPVHVTPALVARLESIARQHGATLYMALLTAFQVLLMEYSGEEDVAVGCPVAGRERTELDAIVGYFVNTLVLRVNMAGNPTFAQLLRRVREVCLHAFSHQTVAFDRLVAELSPARDLRRNPLYQVSFALQNAPDAGQDFGSLESRRVPVHSGTAKFELFLSLTQEHSGLTGTLEYNVDVFDGTTTERMARDLVQVLEQIAADPEQVVGRLCGAAELRRSSHHAQWGFIPTEHCSATADAFRPETPVPVECSTPRRNDGEAAGPIANAEALEQSLRSLWQGVLQVEDIGLDENFFDLGGHSLLAIRLVDAINRQLGSNLRVATLFRAPTIRRQASWLRRDEAISTCVVPIQSGGDRPPLFVIPGYGGAVAPLHALAKALGAEQPLFVVDLDSVHCDTADSPTLEGVATNVLESMRRLQPCGPYYIAGYSLGGRIAYEIAQQLDRKGEEMGLLAMLDCSAPGYPRVQSFISRALLHVKHAARLAPRESRAYFTARVRSLKKYLNPVRVYPQVFREDMVERRTQAAQAIQARAQLLYDASLSYMPRAYAGTLKIVRAAVRTPRLGVVDNDPLLGWQRLVGNRIHLAHMHCTHQEMLEPEHLPALAELLRGWIGRTSDERKRALERA